MNRIKLFLMLVFLQCFCAISCEKPEPIKPIEPPATEPPEEEYPTNLEVIWEAFFHSDGYGDYFLDYAIAGEQYLVLANIFDRTNNKPRGIGVYNMQTGQRHSAWQSDPGGIFAITEHENLLDCKVAGKNKDIILIYSGKNLFAYSLHTGQRMWNLDMNNVSGLPRISVATDHVFIAYGPAGYSLSPSWYRLAIVDVYSGKKTDVMQLTIEDNYEFAINPPSAYVDGGDTLLYFTEGGYNFTTRDGREYAYCYNMTKRQMLWKTERIDRDASSYQPPPFVIDNDKLIVTTLFAVHCLNRQTGEVIWQKDGLALAESSPLYHEGKIYVRSGDPSILFCLDAQSGQMLWKNTTLNPLPAPDGNMAVYKDRLYFSAWGDNATHHLGCVDVHTGEELWNDRGPYGNIGFGVLIDQKTGYLYCNTNWSTLCVDLNKTPNK
jgi:outer membrane protein assembly factor BamB